MVTCVPDAHQVFWSEAVGCSHVAWGERVARALPRAAPVVLVNVGANKGYKVPEFLGLWSQQPVANHVQGWQKHLLDYAARVGSTSLKRASCGNCNDCHASLPAPHSRTGAQVHLLEIAPANQALLRYVLDRAGLDESTVKLHSCGASNMTQRVPIVKDLWAGEERQGVLTGSKALRFARANATMHVSAVALDELFRDHRLDRIYQVSIDTEGFDALVLEGMRGTISQRRVSIIEFEVNQMGFWRPRAPERRTVRRAFELLGSAGYSCFWETKHALLPASGPCFDKRLDKTQRLRWSNVVCAHEPEVLSVLQKMSQEAYQERVRVHGSEMQRPTP